MSANQLLLVQDIFMAEREGEDEKKTPKSREPEMNFNINIISL